MALVHGTNFSRKCDGHPKHSLALLIARRTSLLVSWVGLAVQWVSERFRDSVWDDAEHHCELSFQVGNGEFPISARYLYKWQVSTSLSSVRTENKYNLRIDSGSQDYWWMSQGLAPLADFTELEGIRSWILLARELWTWPFVIVTVWPESVNLRLYGVLYSADSGVLSSLLVEGT